MAFHHDVVDTSHADSASPDRDLQEFRRLMRRRPPPNHLGQLLRYALFRARFGRLLASRVNGTAARRPKALVFVPKSHLQANLFAVKSLEVAGWQPAIIIPRDPVLERFCRLDPDLEIHFYDELLREAPVIQPIVERMASVDELLEWRYGCVRAGRLAASTYLSFERKGRVDLASAEERRLLDAYLYRTILASHFAETALRVIQPELVLFNSFDYTPYSEFLEMSLARNVDCVSWIPVREGILLHRWNDGNLEQDHPGLSSELWSVLAAMPWTEDLARETLALVKDSYLRPPWFGNSSLVREIVDADRLKSQLGLDPRKKTAVVCAHVVWDSPFLCGANLFQDYEEWLVETVRAARDNDRVNWVIKFHPLQGKGLGEIERLRAAVGPWGPHVTVLPAHTGVSTWSVFQMMDYCVTVRGTVGIEAVAMGIPVLTAGTGRYSHKGFTIDSRSREEYLRRLATIERVERPTAAEIALAQKYAYGLLELRPLRISGVMLRRPWYFPFVKMVDFRTGSRQNWMADITAIGDWLRDPARPVEYVDWQLLAHRAPA